MCKNHNYKILSATPANSQAAQEAEKNGKPYHIVISTTPGDLNTPHGVYAKQFFDSAAPFSEKLYDWPIEKVKEYIDKNSSNNFTYLEFSYDLLGRDYNWFRKQCKALNGDVFKIKREILLQWNKSSDLSPFSEEEIMRLTDCAKEPVATLMLQNVFPLNLYIDDFDWRSNLLIGVDVASGMSRDRTAIVVWDPAINQVVASFHNNIIDGFELRDLLIELITVYFQNSILIIESNNSGKQLMDFLLRTPVAKNLFYEKKQVKAEVRVQDVKKQKFDSKMTKVYGVNTNTETRPKMMDILRDIVRDEYDRVNSKDIIQEIAGLERSPKHDRIDHGEGGHDDLVMAYLFTRYVWAYGRNLGKWMTVTSTSGSETIYSNDLHNDYLNKFRNVASLNEPDPRDTIRGTISHDIIEDYYARQQAEYEEKERQRIENQRTRAAQSIFNMNREW